MSKRSALSIPGIYTITNTVTGKVYVGQSINIRVRWVQHKSTLRDNKHRNAYLQHAWNKHGAAAFEFTVHLDLSGIAPTELAAALNEAEIELLASVTETYNLNDPGNGGTIFSEETRQLWSQQRKAMWADPTFKAQRVAAIKAMYANDPEWKANRDAAVKEGKNLPEHRAAVSKHFSALWQNEEHRAAQSAKRTANWQDPAYRAQQAASRRASWEDPEKRTRRLAGLQAAAAKPEVLEARRVGQLRALGQMSEATKRNWQDPEWRKRVIAAQIAGRQRKKQSG